MIESLIVTLREGIEAALVVGIIYAFLEKNGLRAHLKAVWAGLVTAVLASIAGAWALHSVAINEEIFEGLLYLASAAMVTSMVIWMWRHSKDVSRGMKGTLAKIVDRGSSPAVLTGLFLFTFLMVFREGIETALFLAAVSFTTSGLVTLLGSLAGLALAVWFGVLFIRGSVRLDLPRFFKVTGAALLIFVVQLLLGSYHELSEGGWLPANPTTMGTIGPLVRNEFFFIVAVLALPLLALAFPGERRRPVTVPARAELNPAQRRLEKLQTRRQSRVRALAGGVGIAIVALLGLGFTYTQSTADPTPVEPLAVHPDGTVRVALSALGEDTLHRYGVTLADGHRVRFIAMQLASGKVVVGLDACELCGAKGYGQRGHDVFCLHCASIIYPPSIGQGGGCNPIPLKFQVEGSQLVVAASDLVHVEPVFG